MINVCNQDKRRISLIIFTAKQKLIFRSSDYFQKQINLFLIFEKTHFLVEITKEKFNCINKKALLNTYTLIRKNGNHR